MGKTENQSLTVDNSLREQLMYLKLLVYKHGALHQAHIEQMQMYINFCSNMIIEGYIKVHMDDDRLIEFYLDSVRYNKRVAEWQDDKLIYTARPRIRFSPLGYVSAPPFYYEKEAKRAADSIKAWTKEITANVFKVKVYVDGVQY